MARLSSLRRNRISVSCRRRMFATRPAMHSTSTAMNAPTPKICFR